MSKNSVFERPRRNFRKKSTNNIPILMWSSERTIHRAVIARVWFKEMTQNYIELHFWEKRAKHAAIQIYFPSMIIIFFDAHKLAITETIDMMVRDILYWKQNFNKELSELMECFFFFAEVGEKFTRWISWFDCADKKSPANGRWENIFGGDFFTLFQWKQHHMIKMIK